MNLNIKILLVGYEFEKMSKYLDLTQESLSKHFSEVEKAYREEILREAGEEEYYLLEDQYTDKLIEAGQDFPKLLLSSFVVAWYSFMEQKLLDLCKELNNRKFLEESKKSDKGIRRAKKFLVEVAEYEIYSPHWQELVNIGLLRNFIAHCGTELTGSYFRSNDKEILLVSDIGNTFYFSMELALFTYLQKHGLVRHSDSSLKIIPTFDYCKNLVRFGEELLMKLYSDLNIQL